MRPGLTKKSPCTVFGVGDNIIFKGQNTIPSVVSVQIVFEKLWLTMFQPQLMEF